MSIKALLESKIREFDASIDITEGSRIQRTVITPVLEALTLDPLSVSTRDYLYARFTEAFPDSPITRGNALDDILITASEYFLDGYRGELARLKNATSLDNVDLLSDDEADALASNWFVTRDEGARATGSVTVIVDRPTSLSINTTTVRFFSGDKEYAPTVSTLISTDALLAASVGSSLYEFTINVQATAVGAEFNAAAGSITRVTGISNVVSVINNAAILGGIARDSSQYLLSNKLPRAISERSLVTARGIGARISTDIPGVLRYQVIGHGEEEMLRDRVDVRSFAELIASGHIFYMDSFALISAFPHGSSTLSKGDYLQTIGTAGAVDSLRIKHIFNSSETLNASVLSSNPLGFTSLIELEEVPPEGVEAASVSVLRPGSALLSTTVVDSDIGLGGRADVYIKGDTEQSIVGTATLSLSENSYRGRGWDMANSVVTITLSDIIEQNQFKRYQHIILNNVAYTISHIEVVPNNPTAYIHVYGEPSDDSGTDYFIVDELVYNTGREFTVISPSNGGEARLSCIIGASDATLLDIDLVSDGVRQGDVIEIPSLGIRRSIFAVNNSRALSVDSVFQQTLSDVGARVIRFVSRVISPVLELDVPSVPPQHPISIDVEAIRAEVGEVTTGTGNILLPLGGAVTDAMQATGVHTIFADKYNTLDYYSFAGPNDSNRYGNRLAPASRGYLNETSDDLGLCSILVSEPVPNRPDGSVENGVYELRMWCDLFTQNANNIFVLRGDTRTTSKLLDFPGGDVVSGDILRIDTGYLAGDYIIESVLHNTLVREGFNPRASDAGYPVVTLEGEFTYSDITDPNLTLPDEVKYQKVTIVRIYGEFPKNPLAALASKLNVVLTERHTDVNPPGVHTNPIDNWVIGSLSSTFVNAYINGSSAGMFIPTASDEILVDFRSALNNAVLPPQGPQGAPNLKLDSLFSGVLTANYTIIRPSSSIGRVKTRHAGHDVLLARPCAPLVDVDNLIGELYTGTVRSITYKEHTEITGSAGTYHLSSKERYYINGQDYRSWPSDVPPNIYDNRQLLAFPIITSYTPVFENEYVLFDSLVELTAGGLLPVKVTAPSSVTSPYMRNDGPKLIRYPELPIINSALSLVTDQVSGNGLYLAAPVIDLPDPAIAEQICVITLTTTEFSEYPVLYIPPTSPEYDEIINSLGNAVDGTGTRLSTIYRQHDAFFRIEANTPEAYEYFVGLYGQLVVATFVAPGVPDPLYQSDEFLMDTLLPRTGSTYSLPPIGCIPTSVATVSERADKMEVVPSTELSLLEADIVGTRVRVDYRDETYWRRVSYTQGNDVYLDEPLPFGTPGYVAYGLCVLNILEDTASLISDPIFYGGENALDEWDEEFTTHLNTGGASRTLSDVDIGRHITFWGYRSNEIDYRSVLLDGTLPEFDTYEEFVAGMANAERETFGQFEITDVVPTFSPVIEGAQSVPKRIDVTVAGAFSVETPRTEIINPTKVVCAFVITEPTLTLEDDIINNVAKVNLFAQDPFEYRFVGISKDTPDQYLIQPMFGSETHEYELVQDVTTAGADVGTYVLVQDHSLEPTTIETDHLVVLSENTDLVIRTTNSQSYVNDQSMHASGEKSLGYAFAPVDLGTSKSVNEDIEIRVPCTPGTISDSLQVSGFFDPTIGQAQSLVDAPNERPVCADILIKTLHQAYIGLEVSYTGGPTEEEVRKELTSFIKSRVLTDSAITRSKIVSLIMNMGATSVNEPIDLYICVEDNSRRIHKRTIIDGLDSSTLFKSDTTLRTVYPSIAVEDRLGASIVVTRLSREINTVGNGGS